MADNVAVTAGSGTTVAADEVSDGTLGSCKVQYVKLMDGTIDGTSKAAVSASGLKVDLGADNDVTITSGTVTAVTAITNALPAGTNNIGDVDVLTVPADPFGATADAAVTAGATGSISAKLRSISRDIVANIVLAAGTNGIGKLTANSGVDIGDVDVTSAVITGGAIADDSTTPGNPVMVGGTAKETDGTTPGTVSAEDDVARLITDRNRRLLVSNIHPFLWKANENHSSAQTNNELKAAPGAGLSLYVTDIVISNGATAGTVKLVEDTGGTPADLLGPVYLGINAGMSKKFATPIRLTADKNLGFTSTLATTHTIFVSGYTAP